MHRKSCMLQMERLREMGKCGHEVSTEIVLDNTFEVQPSNENAPGPLWPRMYHSDCAQPAVCPCQAKDWTRPGWNMLEVWLGVGMAQASA